MIHVLARSVIDLLRFLFPACFPSRPPTDEGGTDRGDRPNHRRNDCWIHADPTERLPCHVIV
jgi:hypothetical protein